MQIRRSILLFVVVVVALIALILWYGKKQPVGALPTTAVQPNVAPPAASVPGVPVGSALVSTNVPAATAIIATASAKPNPTGESKSQRMVEILSSANDVPIVFYGRLQDQFSNQVAGAEVTGTTTVNNGTSVGANRVTVTSDSNGFFQLDAGKGESLGIMPKKAGYALATTGTEFRYSQLDTGYYVPDPNNPTVIKMWKLQGAEPLVSIDQHYKLPYTGAPVTVNVDLLAGKIVPSGGDLKITVTRPPGIVALSNRQDWGVKIEVVDGGLIETSTSEARVAYAAPDSGYQPSDEFIFSTNAPHKWFGGFDQMFFLRSRSGQQYSKVSLSFNINRNPGDSMSLTLRGVASTSGSRNWEGSLSAE